MSVCEKFLKSDYTIKFINSIINEFCNETESKEDNYILPPNLFKKKNASFLFKFHTVKKMKISQNTFLKILQQL